jgi:hypothetical protein
VAGVPSRGWPNRDFEASAQGISASVQAVFSGNSQQSNRFSQANKASGDPRSREQGLEAQATALDAELNGQHIALASLGASGGPRQSGSASNSAVLLRDETKTLRSPARPLTSYHQAGIGAGGNSVDAMLDAGGSGAEGYSGRELVNRNCPRDLGVTGELGDGKLRRPNFRDDAGAVRELLEQPTDGLQRTAPRGGWTRWSRAQVLVIQNACSSFA